VFTHHEEYILLIINVLNEY